MNPHPHQLQPVQTLQATADMEKLALAFTDTTGKANILQQQINQENAALGQEAQQLREQLQAQLEAKRKALSAAHQPLKGQIGVLEKARSQQLAQLAALVPDGRSELVLSNGQHYQCWKNYGVVRVLELVPTPAPVPEHTS